MSIVSRRIICSIKVQKSSDFDVNLLTAQIDSGLWSTPRYTIGSYLYDLSDHEEDKLIANPDVLFDNYFQNYMKTMNLDFLEGLFPD